MQAVGGVKSGGRVRAVRVSDVGDGGRREKKGGGNLWGGATPFTLRPPFSSSPPPTLSFAPTPPFPPRPACPQVRALPWAPRMPGRALRFVRFGGAARVCFLHAAAETRGAVAPAARSRPLCPPPPRPGFVWSPGPHWRGRRGQTGWTARTVGVRFVAGVARSRTKKGPTPLAAVGGACRRTQ